MVLDPSYRERFAAVAELSWADIERGDPDALERLMAPYRPAPYTAPPLDIRDELVPGPHGDVPVRVYGSGSGPALVWMHGGAFQFGSLDMLEGHAVAAEIAHRWEATVISVDYRLAPAARYPVPLDDCVAAVRWAAERHDRLAVGGASAGGNLAAGTALRLRDDGGPSLRALCLAYPTLHRDQPPPTPEVAALAAELPTLLRFSPETIRQMYDTYLGDGSEAPPYAVPAVAALGGLPPTAIANAEHDDLRTSGEAFAEQLAAAGVPVDVWTEPGTAHGYLNEVEVAGTDGTLVRLVSFLRMQVGS